MLFFPRDLHRNLADRLDVRSLLKLSLCLNLRLDDHYWKSRLGSLSNIFHIDRWKVADWKRVLYEITVIQDYHQLTRAIVLLEDFLNREFSVYRLSEINQIQCHGYFRLWFEIQNFLQPQEVFTCHNLHHNNCLCGFHRYLSENKDYIRQLILSFRSKYSSCVVYFVNDLIKLDNYDNDFYYKLISTKLFNNIPFDQIVFDDADNGMYRFELTN